MRVVYIKLNHLLLKKVPPKHVTLRSVSWPLLTFCTFVKYHVRPLEN